MDDYRRDPWVEGRKIPTWVVLRLRPGPKDIDQTGREVGEEGRGTLLVGCRVQTRWNATEPGNDG